MELEFKPMLLEMTKRTFSFLSPIDVQKFKIVTRFPKGAFDIENQDKPTGKGGCYFIHNFISEN